MSRYFRDHNFDKARVRADALLNLSFTEHCVTQVPSLYKVGDGVLLVGPRGVDPDPYRIYRVLGDGRYKLSRHGELNGKNHRAEDLREDPGHGDGRQSREVVRPAKRENSRVYTSPNLKPKDSGRDVGLVASTGHQSGSLSVQGLDGTIQKDIMKWEPGLPGLSYRFHVTGDDDRSPETRSREELSEFEPDTHYKRIDNHGASMDVIEERRKAGEEQAKAIEEAAKAREELAKARGEERRKAREERAIAFEVETNSHKRSDSNGSLVKPLKMEREEVDPNVFYGEISVGGLKMPFSKTQSEDGLRDLAGDTTGATGPETKHDWTESLLSKLTVRGVFSQLLHQSPPTGTRRWSFKSPLSAFGLGECSLEGGKTRVRWRCVCGRKMYDDFSELRPGAAADLEMWLNNSMRSHAANRASNPSQDYTLRSSNASSAGVSGQRQTAESDISLQPLSWTASTMPDSDKDGAVTIDVHLEKCWLLICGQPRRGPDSLLAQLDLSSKPSDKELFDGMKELHSSLRNTFTLQPVLKGVQTIRFVQASFKN